MGRILILLVLTLSVVADGKQKVKNKQGTVSNGCLMGMAACANKLTGLQRCRSVWNSFALQSIRSDSNNDCKVDENDLEKYFKINVDANDDGKICQKEWNDYMVSYFGFTSMAANGIFQKSYSKVMKAGCVDIKDLENVDGKLPLKTKFLDGLLKNLVSFCAGSQYLYTNRDCWGLVSICKEMSPSLQACKKLDTKTVKTLYEKLRMEQQSLDANKDGKITKQEVNNELLMHFDQNHNGCIDQQEWVRRYSSFYGFTPEFARTFYATIDDNNGNGCISIANFNIPRAGMPADPRPDYLMGVLISMCEAYPHMYADNRDCAGVPDTCKMYFPKLGKCAPFLSGECGLQAYSHCVSNQTIGTGSCTSPADKFEVKFEILKINNQMNTTCVAHDLNAATTPLASPLVLLSTLVLLLHRLLQ